MDAAAYYADLTAQYGRYAGRARGWHYGVWEPDVRTHQQALLRSNELLARDAGLTAASRVLDAGCGIGGLAIWLASTHGCQVTGITVCEPHVAEAGRVAAAAGVSSRCKFLELDMDRLDLPPATFDLVTNQDTLCHAADKGGYLATAARLLRPGGLWRAIDFAVQDAPLSPSERQEYDAVCEGFHLPSMASARQVRSWLAEAGFVDVEVNDLTEQVRPTARRIIRQCRGPRLLATLGLDWIIFSREPRQRRHRLGHVSAALAYSRGLQKGYFRHVFYSARAPRAQGSQP
jgi:cyclopropane fatty-acyl-phospholipid synthase-like methyltransferase